MYSQSFHHPSLRGCSHLYSQTCVRPSEADRLCFLSFFFFVLLRYTSEASDGWISHCSGVNLSCVKLSVRKEAVCVAAVVGDSLWLQRWRSVASSVCCLKHNFMDKM